MELSLGIAIFFELFWLDLIPAGTFVHPNNLLPTFITLGCCRLLGLETSQELFYVILLTLPLGWAGSRLEVVQRLRQNKNYNLLLRQTRSAKDFDPQQMILKSISQVFVYNLLFFCALQLGYYFLIKAMFTHWGVYLTGVPVSWGHLWLFATLGPVLSLRHRQPYLLFIGAILFAGATLWYSYLN